ncbi:UDP-N-acetylmuramoyl-L-alanyl-D-glutamate--2,6-diaminopimelate ligase [Aquibacillus kalidii]|uniref:UDP-N-acetylmuramoyl-L-alanyl-D-glutamate--2, 6-diaminopimelate ligase n=1 Tax=Aquibacillus kalidii TaxID=2762597 RepID=UPI002E2DC476|nr:UDP-N-acetylmuramoyl-L-alanyl-D-glutamate--2,6-diaminopimelate ligase [Aquibacillus kalidii]
MKLSNLIESLQVYTISKDIRSVEITGMQMDSRQVSKGDLFICISGFTVDGHDFAKQAEAKGAVAIIAEKPVDVSIPVILVRDSSRAISMLANFYFQEPTKDLPLIGITGTNGKTSVSYLLEEIFRFHNQKTGLIGTIQMKIGMDSYEVKNTTPDALFLQRSFRKMVDEQVKVAFMEVSSHALDMGRVYGCDFDIAVFTNLSQDHLDYHKDMDDYLRAKSLLFSQLGNSYNKNNPKFAVINSDDVHSHLLTKSTAQPIITYGINSDADITAENLHLNANGSNFDMHTHKGTVTINSKLMGKFSVYNMLAATGAALCAGVPLNVIKQALESTTGVNGRFEPVVKGQSFGVVVDYAHTPDSLENVLTTIKSFAKGNVFVVVGCGGDRDKKKRPLMADIAVKYADEAVFTSDNPRSEDPQAILKDMTSHLSEGNYKQIVNREDAIAYAIQLAKDDDIVLIAGKGHETYQIIGDKVLDFDDKAVAAIWIENTK